MKWKRCGDTAETGGEQDANGVRRDGSEGNTGVVLQCSPSQPRDGDKRNFLMPEERRMHHDKVVEGAQSQLQWRGRGWSSCMSRV